MPSNEAYPHVGEGRRSDNASTVVSKAVTFEPRADASWDYPSRTKRYTDADLAREEFRDRRRREREERILDQVQKEMDEVRVTDPETGGQKGRKVARFDLIPAGPLTQVAEHYGRGAEKYEDRNWERGYDWSLSFAALMRHAWAFWNGEDDDPETGSPHMAAVVFHAFALLEFAKTHPEKDNRPSTQR